MGRDEMFAFVIDGEHIHMTRLGTRAEIASAAAELYERVRILRAAYADVKRAASKLARVGALAGR